MKKSSVISLLLALSTLAAVACGGAGGSNDTTAPSGETTPAETTAPAPVEIVDYNGADIHFFLWSGSKIDVTEETGDVINDATYRRNRKIEDLYNVNFKYTKSTLAAGDYGPWINIVNGEIMAGSDTLGLIGGYGHQFAGTSIDGNYVNLNEYIDFTNEWWPSNINVAGNIGNKMFIAYGNMEAKYYDMSYAIYFNKRLADECKTEDLYDLVSSGKWTFDKMLETAKLGARDLDGNTAFDDNDQFGYITPKAMAVDAFVQAFNIKITDFDSDGNPFIMDLSERYVDGQEKVEAFVRDTPGVRYSNDNTTQLFMNGQALLMPENVGVAHTLREMNDDFGIIPFPKWDEAQDRYITYNAQGNSTAYAIPITQKNPAMYANILDALAYYGYTDVLPEYYERALKGKGTRDNESEAMLDIIFNNVEYDFNMIYGVLFKTYSGPGFLMRDLTNSRSDISSQWEMRKNYYDEVVENIIASLK